LWPTEPSYGDESDLPFHARFGSLFGLTFSLRALPGI
jgi:hypothetical protein